MSSPSPQTLELEARKKRLDEFRRIFSPTATTIGQSGPLVGVSRSSLVLSKAEAAAHGRKILRNRLPYLHSPVAWYTSGQENIDTGLVVAINSHSGVLYAFTSINTLVAINPIIQLERRNLILDHTFLTNVVGNTFKFLGILPKVNPEATEYNIYHKNHTTFTFSVTYHKITPKSQISTEGVTGSGNQNTKMAIYSVGYEIGRPVYDMGIFFTLGTNTDLHDTRFNFSKIADIDYLIDFALNREGSLANTEKHTRWDTGQYASARPREVATLFHLNNSNNEVVQIYRKLFDRFAAFGIKDIKQLTPRLNLIALDLREVRSILDGSHGKYKQIGHLLNQSHTFEFDGKFLLTQAQLDVVAASGAESGYLFNLKRYSSPSQKVAHLEEFLDTINTLDEILTHPISREDRLTLLSIFVQL